MHQYWLVYRTAVGGVVQATGPFVDEGAARDCEQVVAHTPDTRVTMVLLAASREDAIVAAGL